MTLLRYLFVRTFTLRQQGCSRSSSHNARRLGTPSSVTLRGTRGSFEGNACAAAMPRSRRSRKSTVFGLLELECHSDEMDDPNRADASPPITYDIDTITRPIADLSPEQIGLTPEEGDGPGICRTR
jgi:hypothetical protein